MADKTGIEWTDATWNPTTGCDQVSPGCDNCYALTMAKRLKAMGSPRYQNDGDPATSGPGFGFTMHADALDQRPCGRSGKHEAGRELDGRTWDEYPKALVSTS